MRFYADKSAPLRESMQRIALKSGGRMNRRQETVLRVAGLVVAAICAYHGASWDWIYGQVAPALIVAGLVIYALRTREPAVAVSARNVVSAVVIVLSFLAFHHARRAEREASDAAEAVGHYGSVERAIDDAASQIERRIDDLDR
jgi:hypothetical protein